LKALSFKSCYMYNQNKCKLQNHLVILYGYESVTSTYAMKYLSMYKLIMKQKISHKINVYTW